jgi:hypothetical protein
MIRRFVYTHLFIKSYLCFDCYLFCCMLMLKMILPSSNIDFRFARLQAQEHWPPSAWAWVKANKIYILVYIYEDLLQTCTVVQFSLLYVTVYAQKAARPQLRWAKLFGLVQIQILSFKDFFLYQSRTLNSHITTHHKLFY